MVVQVEVLLGDTWEEVQPPGSKEGDGIMCWANRATGERVWNPPGDVRKSHYTDWASPGEEEIEVLKEIDPAGEGSKASPAAPSTECEDGESTSSAIPEYWHASGRVSGTWDAGKGYFEPISSQGKYLIKNAHVMWFFGIIY